MVLVDWSEPVVDGKIGDTSRIDSSIETIQYILDRNGSVEIVSHFGREGESLKPMFDYFSANYSHIFKKAIFLADPFDHDGRNQIQILGPGDIAVFDNIRKWPEEENNDAEFAEKLAKLATMYVNEGFSVSHREHASVVGVPKFLPHYAGLHFLKEVENLSKAFEPEHPFLFILGGAKFETKLPLVEKFTTLADSIFIGGALAKEAALMEVAKNPKVIFPVGDIAALDANTDTLELLKEKISQSKFILWNGPLGKYEEGYKSGTEELLKILADSSAITVIGGGDTLVLINELGLKDKFSFVSVAGGAMLDFLANGTLPAIEALQ